MIKKIIEMWIYERVELVWMFEKSMRNSLFIFWSLG